MHLNDQQSGARVFSGAPWEKQVGYCRAIKRGNLISVSGTAPVADDGSVFKPNNAYAQSKRCIEIIEKSLLQLGCRLSDVVRTRMFVTDITRWQEFGRAHGEAFGSFPPSTSMVEVKSLIAPGMLIEIEADAIVHGSSTLAGETRIVNSLYHLPKVRLWADTRVCSPWVLSVWVALKKKNVPFDVSYLDLETDQHKHGEYAARSLNLKVPSLQIADHWISESGAIIEFLEEIFSAPHYPTLFPLDPIQKAIDRSLMQYLRTDFFQLRKSLPFENLMLRRQLPKNLSMEAENEATRLLNIASKRVEQNRLGNLADFELSFYLQRIIYASESFPNIDVRVRQYANTHWDDDAVRSWRDLDRIKYFGEPL